MFPKELGLFAGFVIMILAMLILVWRIAYICWEESFPGDRFGRALCIGSAVAAGLLAALLLMVMFDSIFKVEFFFS